MHILNIEYKDIHVTLDLSLKELNYLKDILDCADIKYDGEKKPEMKDACAFLNNYFYPFLVDFIKKTEEQNVG